MLRVPFISNQLTNCLICIVCVSTVKLYIDTTVAWIRRYIKHSPHSSRPDVKRHLPFYSACQAIFYIFVYQHEDILHTYGDGCSCLGPTVFREPRNFEPSRGIWPLPRNFRVSAEFHGIPRKYGNFAATAKFRKSALLL